VLGLADDEPTEAQTPGGVEGDRNSEALMTALSNPQAIASAGFALVSLLGSSCVMRLLRFGASGATLAALLARAMAETHEAQQGLAKQNGHTHNARV